MYAIQQNNGKIRAANICKTDCQIIDIFILETQNKPALLCQY